MANIGERRRANQEAQPQLVLLPLPAGVQSLRRWGGARSARAGCRTREDTCFAIRTAVTSTTVCNLSSYQGNRC